MSEPTPIRHAIGIDIGTSAVKAALLSSTGTTDSETSRGYPTTSLRPGHAEQDPDRWWTAVGEVLTGLLARNQDLDAANTTIGLTGQMHTTVLRDEAGALLRPAILWSDNRAAAECVALTSDVPQWADVTGNTLIPAFTAAHLAWVRADEPHVFERIHTISVPKDEIRARLGAGWATEPSDASAMSLLDTRTDEWATDLVAAVGIRLGALPPIVPSGHVTGHIQNLPGAGQLSQLLGTPVIGGVGDQAAQAVALGVTGEGSLGLSIGTSGVAFGAITAPRPGSFRHAHPATWLALDSTHAAGLALSWWSAISQVAFDDVQPVDHSSGRPAPMFLPFIQGHRGGHGAPGTLTDLHVSHGARDIAAAVMEGVALELVRLARSVAGPQPGRGEVGVGGRAGSIPGLRALIAAGLDRPVRFSDRGSAFGAAALAAQTAGWYDDFLAQATDTTTPTTPDARLAAQIGPRIRRYEQLIRELT